MARQLTINQCPVHKEFYAIMVEDTDETFGVRVTPSKCCGTWRTINAWRLSAADWRELAELAADAAVVTDLGE